MGTVSVQHSSWHLYSFCSWLSLFPRTRNPTHPSRLPWARPVEVSSPVLTTAMAWFLGWVPYVYGKREAKAKPEPYTVGQIAAGAHIASALADGRPHNVGVITNAAISPVYHPGLVYYGKRSAEAEADPALALVSPYYHVPVVAATNAALGHAVAVHPFGGVTHSANVGICTNNKGVQVAC